MIIRKKNQSSKKESTHKTLCLDVGQAANLRKILRTAALSVALISWYTTANGLHQYVFGTLWHAYVISAALQGALFALSILGIELLLYLSTLPKQLGLLGAWFCLLVTSSIFSYIYISHDVYSDQLLREDAHRVLRETCLTTNYTLSGKADELLRDSEGHTGILTSMDVYVAQLAVLENGVDLSGDDSDTQLYGLRDSLLPYAYTYKGTNNTQPIAECVDTSILIEGVDKIITGRFTDQDIKTAKIVANDLAVAIDVKKANKQSQKNQKSNEKSDYQNRLRTFVTTGGPDYQRLEGEVNRLTNEINALDNDIFNLDDQIIKVRNVPVILNSVNASMSVSLYQDVQDLHGAINAKNIDTQNLIALVEKIYIALLKNSANLSKDDPRLIGYSSFKDDLEHYVAVIDGQQQIQKEIDSLYAIENVKALTADTIEEDAWVIYWQDRLNALKESAQSLQKGGLDTEVITRLIHELEQKERLYLSDLNDFERAWGLLFDPHPYKSLLIFSMAFSFGIDLFSVLMSVLLYLFKPQRQCTLISNSVPSQTNGDIVSDLPEDM